MSGSVASIKIRPWMPAVSRALSLEMARVRLRNPRFSQRAFAKRLGLTSSALSEVLSQKRNLSRTSSERILRQLGEDPAGLLNDGIDSGRPLKTVQLDYDQFALISEWHNIALLSLLETKGARGKVSWIAKRLRIEKGTARVAIERLMRLGLLKKGAGGEYELAVTDTAGADGVPDLARRRHHLEGLGLAERSLLEDPLELRDHYSMTLAMPTRKIPEAAKRIRKFINELTQWLESSAERDEVYRVAVQLFPLTRTSTKTNMYKGRS
jgi:transcriptional regulator with XRE-family HTH domain